MKFIIPYPTNKTQRSGWCKQYGLNAIYKGKIWQLRQADSKFFWHYLVKRELMGQKIPRKLFEKPVTMTFWWNDGMDIDNHAYMGKMDYRRG